MSMGIQLPADRLLSQANMSSFCKSLTSYAGALYQQVKEASPHSNSKDLVGHSREVSDWVFWKIALENSAYASFEGTI